MNGPLTFQILADIVDRRSPVVRSGWRHIQFATNVRVAALFGRIEQHQENANSDGNRSRSERFRQKHENGGWQKSTGESPDETNKDKIMAHSDRAWTGTGPRPISCQSMDAGTGTAQVAVWKLPFNTRMHSSRMRTVRCSSSPLGGVCPAGCLPGGGGRGVYTPLPPHPPPPVDRMRDAYENITFPQLRLRTVTMEANFYPVAVPVPLKFCLDKPLGICTIARCDGSFTLPDTKTETDTDTDKLWA